VERGEKVIEFGRKPPKNDETEKQYFNWKIFGFFPGIY
jgi:hypothetical protein